MSKSKSKTQVFQRKHLQTLIRRYKRIKCHSMEGLAAEVGMSKGTIYNHLNGSACMSSDNLERLLDYLEGALTAGHG